jgi:hypothetical protein
MILILSLFPENFSVNQIQWDLLCSKSMGYYMGFDFKNRD